MPIKKDDFLGAVAQQAQVTPEQAGAVLDAVGVVVARQLAVDSAVRIPGLVNIVAKPCAARPGRNLRTGEPCIIPAANRIRISMSAPLDVKYKAALAAAEQA